VGIPTIIKERPDDVETAVENWFLAGENALLCIPVRFAFDCDKLASLGGRSLVGVRSDQKTQPPEQRDRC